MYVLIIGAGGIGSFLIQFLDKVGLYAITVADPDKVETKNLPYQNFNEDDVAFNKASRMKDKFFGSVKVASEYPVLTEKQMQGYDLVICCVDNLSVRRTLYNTSIKWLDLRAQGRNAALVSHKADPKMYDMLWLVKKAHLVVKEIHGTERIKEFILCKLLLQD